MKTRKAMFMLVVAFVTTLVTSNSVVAGPPHVSVSVSYGSPSWGPTYYSGVRYYYFPDIEVYYDLSTNEYVFFRDGRWLVSRSMPSMYAGYDLRSGFVVSLNTSVYRPWLRHSYYCSHYPRYYYKTRYRNDYGRMRGYNENDRRPHYRDNNGPNRPNNNSNDNRYNNNNSGRSDRYDRSSRYDQNNHPGNDKQSHKGGDAERKGNGRR